MGKESLHANSLISVYGRAFGCGDFLSIKLKIISATSVGYWSISQAPRIVLKKIDQNLKVPLTN